MRKNKDESEVEKSSVGYAYQKAIYGKNKKLIDYELLNIDRNFEKISKQNRKDLIGKKLSEIALKIGGNRDDWLRHYFKSTKNNEISKFQIYSDNLKLHLKIVVIPTEPDILITLLTNITESFETKSKLIKRVKELNCLYNFSEIIEKPEIGYQDIIKETVDSIPLCWQYPDSTCAKIIFEEKEYKSTKFKETEWMQSDNILIHGKIAGQIQIYYTGKKISNRESLFLEEEKLLLNAICQRLGRVIERFKATEELQKSEKKYRSYIDNAPDGVFIVDKEGSFLECNRAACDMSGYSQSEIINMKIADLLHPDSLETSRNKLLKVVDEGKSFSDMKILRKDEATRYWQINSVKLDEDYYLSFTKDITEIKIAEKALIESEERFRNLFHTMPQGIVYQDREGRITLMNSAAEEILGIKLNGTKGAISCTENLNVRKADGSSLPADQNPSTLALQIGSIVENVIMGAYNPQKDEYRWIQINAVPEYRENEPEPFRLYTTLEDITEKIKAQKALIESELHYRTLYESMNEGVCLHQVIYDENGNAVNYRILDVNPAYEKILGIKSGDVLNKLATEAYAMKKAPYLDIYAEVAISGIPHSFETYVEEMEKWFRIQVFSPGKGKFATVFENISERKKAEAELVKYDEELRERNKELRSFIYAASHDLKEPLRMVSSFLGLLKRKYQGQLDSDADDYIHFAVDGANRMSDMIQSLLEYSRLDTRECIHKPLDVNKIIEKVLENIKPSIDETGAVITYDKLPSLMGDENQIIRLFQNLIINAIHYRRKDSIPEITIEGKIKNSSQTKELYFSVQDNGIGIDKQYHERIFEIFQRLHSRKDYPGTGIGLSICKRIVEKYGGKIWVESKEGKGTKFKFILKSN